MAGKDLARTRVMYVGGPDEIQQGAPEMFSERAMAERGVQAIGRYRPVGNGEWAVPVVYVSKRAKPWHERHRRAILITVPAATFVASLAGLILWVGWAWFIGGVAAAAVFVAMIVRMSRGGGGGRSVSVTTTTTTKVRVR
jgi:hypothetical protein